MASGPIALLKDTDLQFVPEPTNFQEILDSELGQFGTGADGFDAIFNDAVNLAAEAGTVLAALDGELTAASTVVSEFDTTAPADIALQLQPAAIAADSVLNDFVQSVAPTPAQGSGSGGTTPAKCAPGSIVGGLTIGKPDPNPYPAIPGTTQAYPFTYPAMCTGNTPTDFVLASDPVIGSYGKEPWTGHLASGDSTVFSVVTKIGANAQDGSKLDVVVRITPSKAGRFQALVAVNGPIATTQFYGVQVTIVAP